MSAHTAQRNGERRPLGVFDLDIAATRSGWLLTALCLAYSLAALCLQPGRYMHLAQSYAEPFVFFLPTLLAAGLGVMRRNLNPSPLPEGRTVIQFLYQDLPASKRS